MLKGFLYPLRRLHGIMHDRRVDKQTIRELQCAIQSCSKHTILFVDTPTHGNLGDHAIAVAAKKILNGIAVDYMEITFLQLSLLQKYKKLGIMNGHPIVVNGGGNIGTLWPQNEDIFRAVVISSPDSRILCLPNTAFFENTKSGREELEKSKQIYNAHPHLWICAREHVSFELLRQIQEKVILVPDLALLLNKSEHHSLRKGCMLCLRKDREKIRTEEDDAHIWAEIKKIYGQEVWESDMDVRRKIIAEQREIELEKKFDIFRHAEVVVTDRLHGMIFAAITGTPCVVINSKSPKVKGCYQWIEYLPYVRFWDGTSSLAELCKTMPKGSFDYDNKALLPYYEKLKEYILQLLD